MILAFYKGTRPHRQGLFNRLVRWWTNGSYSHVELVLYPEKNLCASSSFLDGGVRFKTILFKADHWDFVSVPRGFDAAKAAQWFYQHQGQGYDTLGLLGFIWRRKDGSKKRWICSEAVASALGFQEPWRYDPNTLYALVSSFKEASWIPPQKSAALESGLTGQ